MKNNKQILIIAFIALLFISTGSTYALCDVDPTIKTIRWFGDTTLEILKYSGYISLSYAFANGCYNYHYYIPKIGQSIFLIKWGDKLNGWLGFSSKGVLEQELELAKLTYSPLYKDFLEGVNNNFVAPFLGYLHIRPLTVERRVPFFVDRTRVEYRDRIEERTVYRNRDNENILSVRDSLDQLRSVANQNNILSNGLQQNFLDLQTEIEDLELEITKLNKENKHVQKTVHVVQDDPNFIWSSGIINSIIEKWLEEHVQYNSTCCTRINLLISNFLSNNPSIKLDVEELNKGGRFTTKIVNISKILFNTNDIQVSKGNKRQGSSSILGLKLK